MQRAVRNVGRPGLASCALAAVETALWDAAARLLDLPLAVLLGRVHGEVAVYGSGGFTSYEWLRIAAMAAAHNLDVSGHCAQNLTAPVAAVTPNIRHLEWFHDHERIEAMLFDGALDPTGGAVRPDLNRPGHGMSLRDADAEPYRVA